MSQPASTTALPYPLPAPVKALGEPEEVFLPSKQPSALGTLTGTVLASAALLLFGIGGMLLYCAVHHFGTNPPPTAVCWGGGAGLVLLASGAVFGSYYYLSGKGDIRQVYLIFPQCLVEMLPTHHRIIPWEVIEEKMATSKATVAVLRQRLDLLQQPAAT
jgi:hypothetical protein